MDATPLLFDLPEYGSDAGIHYWMSWLGCTTKAKLDEQYRKYCKENGIPARTYDTDSGALTGTIGHALIELHLRKLLTPNADPSVAVEFSHVVADKSRGTAERCFTAWREKQGDRWGQIVDVEPERVLSPGLSRRLFGVPELTGKMDFITELSAADVAWFRSSDIPLLGSTRHLEPGRWIVDNKFYGRREAHREQQALWSHQFALYPELERLVGSGEVKGVLQNTIYTTKDVGFEIIVIPGGDPDRLAALRNILKQARERREAAYQGLAGPLPVTNNCWGWNRQCPYLGERCHGA